MIDSMTTMTKAQVETQDLAHLSNANAIAKKAFDIVSCIEALIDAIRSSFPPLSPANNARQLPRTVNLDLYAALKGVNIVERTLEACGGVKLQNSELGVSSEILGRMIEGDESDARLLVLANIIWPLLQSLHECYHLLDQIPEPEKSKDTGQKSSSRKNKPAPPLGILSIRNYTDIGCLLEFVVCTSIVPNLDPHVLIPVIDRARNFLPRAMAGRIPRQALLWGTANKKKTSGCRRSELQISSIVVGQLVLLDRFRPMMMPRHLPDIYAAIFQSEALQAKSTVDVARFDLLTRELGVGCDDAQDNKSEDPEKVDILLRIKAFQTLLQHGLKAPRWLKSKVSPMLNLVACQDLSSLLAIFCPVYGNDQTQTSAASQRLGRAIASSTTTWNTNQLQHFSHQMLLVCELRMNEVKSLSMEQMVGVQTVWAVLCNSKLEWIQKNFASLVLRRLLDIDTAVTVDCSMHRTVRSISVLFSCVPPSINVAKACQGLLFTALKGTGSPTVLSQLTRLASIHSIEISAVKSEARIALQMIGFVMSTQSTFPMTGRRKVGGDHVFALSLICSLAPFLGNDSAYDTYGIDLSASNASMQKVVLKECQHESLAWERHMQRISERASSVLEFVLLPLVAQFQDSQDLDTTTSLKSIRNLPAVFLRFLLALYLSDKSDELTSNIELEHLHSFRLAAMVMLPLFCEKLSPELILVGGADDGAGVLSTLHYILQTAAERLELVIEPDCPDHSPLPTDDDTSTVHDHVSRISAIFSILGYGRPAKTMPRSVAGIVENGSEADDVLVAVVSVALSILVAVLESGALQRSPSEETILKGFMNILRPFSDVSLLANQDDVWAQAGPSFADMASHATVLIASRGCSDEQPSTHLTSDSSRMYDEKRLALMQVAEDLKSKEPPIRARGLVTLGRTVRANAWDQAGQNGRIAADITDVQGITDKDLVVESLRLSAIALEDPESYVYLAAIQTIAVLADADPSLVLPLVSTMIVSPCGANLKGTEVAGDHPNDLFLSSEQKVKLVESLICVIRRRATIVEYLPLLFNHMVFGGTHRIGTDQNSAPSSEDQQQVIERTHEYFIGKKSTDWMDQKDEMDERTTRLLTGGPLFDIEELDLLRAARISILSEAIMASDPISLVTYTTMAVEIAKTALVLEKTRPVTRAAATLASAIYGAVEREQSAVETYLADKIVPPDTSIRFTLSLISSGEESLHAIIRNIYEASNGSTVADPATISRCQEALAIHANIEESGLFSIARIMLKEKERSAKSSKFKILEM